MRDFPRYRSHKVVGAVKIHDVEARADGGLDIHLVDGHGKITLTQQERLHKPRPHKGWYVVEYSNDHLSFSPADAFEQGYTRVQTDPQKLLPATTA